MDFLYGLNNMRYAALKAEIVNDMQKGVMTQPSDLNTVCVLASRRVVVRSAKEGTFGATFALIDESVKQNGKAPTKNGGSGKMKEEKLAARLAKMKCFNCGKFGHPAKSCSHKEKEQTEEPPMAGMTYNGCLATKVAGRLHEYYEVCIDNRRQVNIIDPRLLVNLRTSQCTYRSMNGASETQKVGYLEGVFDCQTCESFPANILSMADIVGKQSGCVCPAEEYTRRAERARERRDLRERVYVVE